jgi:hypothetical protein
MFMSQHKDHVAILKNPLSYSHMAEGQNHGWKSIYQKWKERRKTKGYIIP